MPIQVSAAGGRTFSRRTDIARAAAAALGKPVAIEGQDFVVEPKGERFAMVLKSGKNAITAKIAPDNRPKPKSIVAMAAKIDGARDITADVAKALGAPYPAGLKAVGKALAGGKKPAGKKAAQKPAKAPKAKAAPKTAAKTKKAASAAPSKPSKASGGKAKVEIIAGLLKRTGGCTRADILKATGWPSVSVPQQAAAAGLALKSEKVKGSPTRYWAE